uniref:phosphoenolpyruvate--glycerone phosphotransferase n=1 Tax=Neobacillus citreus TaxID=2833578 RepID=A0A942SY99_9BACI
MTRLFNDPADFPAELLEGFAAAYPEHVVQVPGGVVRATEHDEVAVVVGGGTGHYPTFCGLVGTGLAHGAAMGNLFSSPSATQAVSVGRAADRGRGVVYTFGNYAGDVLHFGEAAQRLGDEGIDARVVLVTDDIASAPADERHKRRGIAGDLTVFKVLGAAAGEGRSLDDVVAIGERANDRTRSLGVAFSGCTLPGADEPLFTVPDGMMSVGLGIHGEPGIADVPVPTADGLAELLVERLLADLPDAVEGPDGQRAAVLLNGLGTVKYEELFVVWRRVHELLTAAGVTIVSPDLGELCTSLDMSGVSLTLFWLDDELERLWTTPSDCPGYRKGAAAPARQLDADERAELVRKASVSTAPIEPGTPESQAAAARVVEALELLHATLVDAAAELGRIDAVAGDGDHGIGMERGARAAKDAGAAAAAAGAGAGTVLTRAGTSWSDVAGGTSGALWGAALRAVGARIGDHDDVDRGTLVAALLAGRDAITSTGGAIVGDKTMVDTLVPWGAALADGASAADAARVAAESAVATADLVPKLGRARPLAEKSLGTPDAGAVSMSLVIGALTAHLTQKEGADA